MKSIKITMVLLMTALTGAWSGALFAQQGAAPFREGVHYTKLDQAAAARTPEVITVTEIFSYGCHACNDFEPFMQSWKSRQAADVKLNRLPVGFGRRAWEILAKGYLMAEIMGVEETTHVPMMNAIWKEKRQMRSIEDIANFYAEKGVDKTKFMALDNGFMLNMRQKQVADKLGIYAPRGTPTMVVNGKYKVYTGQAVPSYEAMLSVVDFLVQKERSLITAARASAAPEAKAEVEAATASN